MFGLLKIWFRKEHAQNERSFGVFGANAVSVCFVFLMHSRLFTFWCNLDWGVFDNNICVAIKTDEGDL